MAFVEEPVEGSSKGSTFVIAPQGIVDVSPRHAFRGHLSQHPVNLIGEGIPQERAKDVPRRRFTVAPEGIGGV
jgi:hypothetical protein